MLKKSLSLAVLLFLSACSSNIAEQKFPNAKYKISDKEMKAFILKMNNAEQCIHPELKGLTYEQAEQQIYSKYSDGERFIWQMGIMPEFLVGVIGEKNLLTMMEDDDSFNYFYEKQKQLNNQQAKVDPVECEKFKVEFFDALDFLEGNQ